MLTFEELGVKQSFKIILTLDGLVLKTHGFVSDTYKEVYSARYSQIGEMPFSTGIFSNELTIGDNRLSFNYTEHATIIRDLIELGKKDPTALEQFIGPNSKRMTDIKHIKPKVLEDYIDTLQFSKLHEAEQQEQRAKSRPERTTPPKYEEVEPKPAAPKGSGGMFSPQLDALIHATLEDGKLEDHEKAALVKRATAEGADLAELEIYINSLLQKRRRELNLEEEKKAETRKQKKQEEFGRVCPNCGRQVEPLALKCECGYEFTATKARSSAETLAQQIASMRDERKIMDTIALFPIPNTKEDIVEFLALATPNSRQKGGLFGTVPKRLMFLSILLILVILFALIIFNPKEPGLIALLLGFYGGVGVIIASLCLDKDTLRWNKRASVWHTKLEQVLMKGRSLHGDAEFSRLLDYYEQKL